VLEGMAGEPRSHFVSSFRLNMIALSAGVEKLSTLDILSNLSPKRQDLKHHGIAAPKPIFLGNIVTSSHRNRPKDQWRSDYSQGTNP
jgi:hypothetical protein